MAVKELTFIQHSFYQGMGDAAPVNLSNSYDKNDDSYGYFKVPYTYPYPTLTLKTGEIQIPLTAKITNISITNIFRGSTISQLNFTGALSIYLIKDEYPGSSTFTQKTISNSAFVVNNSTNTLTESFNKSTIADLGFTEAQVTGVRQIWWHIPSINNSSNPSTHPSLVLYEAKMSITYTDNFNPVQLGTNF